MKRHVMTNLLAAIAIAVAVASCQSGSGGNQTASGILVYVMGLDDKKYLPDTYGKAIGKASVTGYCIRFKKLKDINIEVLEAAMRDGIEKTSDR